MPEAPKEQDYSFLDEILQSEEPRSESNKAIQTAEASF